MKKHQLGAYLLAGIVASIFVYGIVRLFLLRYEAGDIYPPYSSLRADPLGTKALYEGIDNLPNVSCFRNYTPFTELGDLEQVTIFYPGLDPAGFLFGADKESVEATEKIVENGGRLVVSFPPVSKLGAFAHFWQKDPDDGQSPEKSAQNEQEKSDDEPLSEESPEAEDAGVDIPEPFKLDERWGVELDTAVLPKQDENDDNAATSVAHLAIQGETSLPASLSWHTALYFTPTHDDWRVIYRRGTYAVLIEKTHGQGTIVLSADSYFLSNEAMRNERHPELLAWLTGKHSQVMFDETHFGIMESPGIASLIRKYRLEGIVAGLVVLASLFVWKNTTSFVPRQDEKVSDQPVGGKDMMSGLVNLLRSNISSKEIVPTCFAEWKKTFAHLQKDNPETFEQIAALIHIEETRSSKERNPVALYQKICRILTER